MIEQEEHIKEEEKKKPIFLWTVAVILLAIIYIWQDVSGRPMLFGAMAIIAFGLAGFVDILRARIQKEKPNTLAWIFVGLFLFLIVAFFFVVFMVAD
jgi:predicted membrane channel-forming protein YqfA (hemolysin III family)